MNEIIEFLSGLFGTESWPARWVCGKWTPFHGWLYIVSDVLIWAAYFTIPYLLIKFLKQKKNLPLIRVFYLFGTFILMCGLTHLLDAAMFYWPAYRLSGLFRLATAAVSWATVVVLFRVFPEAMRLKTGAEYSAELEERKKVEGELKLSESKLKMILESAPEAILILGEDLNVETSNKNLLSLFNMTLEEIKEKSLDQLLIDENNNSQFSDSFNNLEQGHIKSLKAFKGIKKGTSSFFADIRINKFDHDGKTHYILIIRDVSSEFKYEMDLLDARKRAEENAQLKQEFLANMSHEIRTPMNSIIGFSRIMLTRNIDGEAKELAEIIYESTEDLLVIVNDILDFSKLESGKMHLEPSHFLLKERLSRIQKMFRVKAQEKGLEFNFNTGDLVPEAIFCDETRFAQVINNLVSNAIKYTDKGYVNLNVSAIPINDAQCNIRIEVEDSGLGIPQSKIKEIFESFVQVEGRLDRSHGGTGLGLAIVKKIVNILGGYIDIESTEGKGSKFVVTFPMKIGDKTKVKKRIVNKEELLNIEGLKVLMAEDNRNNQILVRKICKDWKVELTVVDNGEEAVKQVKENEFDVVLMDIQMPVMDGETATRLIKAMPSKEKLPIVALTAHVLEKEVSRLKKLGMEGYLFKPFRPLELVQLLHNFKNA